MSEIFTLILDMGAISTVFILAILLLRVVFTRFKGRVGRAIWLAVGIRLLVPLSFADFLANCFQNRVLK